ncbi:helix-turn-helix domain-containing protein [Bacteroides sp. KFT8]|jgi:excisionase family DNA binding protein|uniref:helix-turn-helix domain-containing protein n=1 Tax=Bacteroides sp. KFT8 TaxID=2025659 RepID=UPI000C044FB9|nr:helix-turn-helix domain-containing protein [Bacteroides sp. KFT8]MBP7984095.1 helix-turn-helix domain-containing protein [Bacteroidaceae bacterium]
MARINQKILCKRMEELELKLNSVNPIEADEIKKRLSKIESMLYACKDMLTSQEAADYTGLSLSQLYKMTSSMAIPYYKPRGKMVYFDKKELDNWMRQNPQLIIQTIRVHAER